MTTLLLLVIAFLLGVWIESKHDVSWRLDAAWNWLRDRPYRR